MPEEGLEPRQADHVCRVAKVRLGCPITATKTARDAIAALELACDRAAELFGRPLIEDLTDEHGELRPLILVTDDA
jgi:hypothetical protein